MDGLKVVTNNVRGLNDLVKRKQTFEFFRKLNADIIMAQETYSSKNKQKIWRSQWGSEIYFSHGNSNSKGVAILMSKNLDYKLLKTVKDQDGRKLLVLIEHNDVKILLVNIYAPNDDDPSFFVEVMEAVSEFEYDMVVWGGDFNKTLKSNDKKGGEFKESKSAQFLKAFLEEEKWVDIWRLLYPSEFHFTWKRRNPLILTRIDYFLIPEAMIDSIEDCEIIANPLSDHSAVNYDMGRQH